MVNFIITKFLIIHFLKIDLVQEDLFFFRILLINSADTPK